MSILSCVQIFFLIYGQLCSPPKKLWHPAVKRNTYNNQQYSRLPVKRKKREKKEITVNVNKV